VTRLLLLPLDDRPVNYDHPWWLGRAAGIDVVRPPREWLGNPFREADSARLAEWFRDQAPAVDALVVAIDTLAYGGLIPSRQSETPLAEVIDALDPMRSVRVTRPELPVFAFNILMRVNRSNTAEEEKGYWADHGAKLFRISYLDDKARVRDASEVERDELRALTDSIPSQIVANYRTGRARNHEVNRLMLDWVEAGVVNYAVIAQDDTAPYGWNIAEARTLRDDIAKRGLGDRASVYAGADEVGSLLLAAFACRVSGFRPRIWTRYSGVDGPSVVTAFEDRPLGELIKAHLGPLGGKLAGSPEDADLVLAVNAPGEAQAEGWLQLAVLEPGCVPDKFTNAIDREALAAVQREMRTTRRDVDQLAREIQVDLDADRNVAVVDVSFFNGADLGFADRLQARVRVGKLAAYAAWNTAGNSLGSALAQGVVRAMMRTNEPAAEAIAAHIALLAIHWLDDYAFQGIVRSEALLDDLPALGLAPTFMRLPEPIVAQVEASVNRRMAPYVQALGDQLKDVATLEIDPATLPWKRLFEIAISPHVRLT
jgi:hypothetical protein